MKNILIFLLLILVESNCFSQSIEYDIKQNIHYYSDSINESDVYINERCVLDIYYPKNKKGFATIVWIHGGGLISFQKEIPKELKNKGVAIIGINYRLYPKVKAPVYIEEAAAAVAWTYKNILKFGGNEDLIFISGHSAGGYLARIIGLDKKWLAIHNIDAQLTTEIFGLFAPLRPDVALKLAKLPIQTTARENAEWISEFYVIIHSLTSYVDQNAPIKEQVLWMADEARKRLPNKSYSAKMYDFVKNKYDLNIPWEQTRDALYKRYQAEQQDGYYMTSKNLYCNGCFAAGINFGSSIISLLYGEGDLKSTIKIGTLAGWDSYNPTATWGGLLGFMVGKDGIENAFGTKFSEKFNIHRTRKNFPNNGIYTFSEMAKIGIDIIDRVVLEEMGGGVNLQKNIW